MDADQFARRIDDVRHRVQDIEGSEGVPEAAVQELLLAVEELRVAEEELRQQNEAMEVAQHQLEDERRRYEHLFRYAPDAYLLTDLNGIVREANLSAARLLNTRPRFLPGKAVVSFVAPEDRRRIRVELDRWRSEPTPKILEVRLQPRNGEPFDAAIALSVARGGAHDTAIGFRWLVRDISAQRQLNDELRLREESARREAEASEAGARHVQKLESIGVLAGGIAHDFNNLLHVVLGNADLARLHLSTDSPAREHLDEVVRATERAAELTQQLLAYSGRGAVERRHLDLSEEVREMATLLRTAISKQAGLVWDLATDLPAISAGPTQVRQIVMNLLTNASDALGDASGTITLRTGRAEDPRAGSGTHDFVFLEVTDTGCGMDAGTLQRIFDPFFSTKFSGRGLGLAAVMGIVESHHGHIRIRTAPGDGTTFRILFPAVGAPADDIERPRTSGADWRGRGTVLLAEDEEGVREVVGRMLERMGFRVLPAQDGMAALEALDRSGGAITAVLLDVSMPRMGGSEVLRRIRETRPDLPVILMSGYTEQEVASKLLNGDQSATGFLQKPFLPEDLASVLRHLAQPSR
ncbi:MAG TPA: ATP-binding protein [Gemmatimonadales bacterium]|nr:ATP-binding protein [Gemmatimonadales bacterium]